MAQFLYSVAAAVLKPTPLSAIVKKYGNVKWYSPLPSIVLAFL